MRPLIGITIDNDSKDHYESPYSYAQAVEKAGGLPILLPFHVDLSLIPTLVDRLDGILFSGGDDLDPALYSQSWHKDAHPILPARQNFELALLREIEKRRTPALGVCLGSQLMNVHRGGSLHQFLPEITRIEHRTIDGVPSNHNVRIDLQSQLGRALGKPEISVNSYHKQAADRLGQGLIPVATAPDGLIEAFEDPSYPLFAAVQWHPERQTEHPEHLALFRLLTQAAAAAAASSAHKDAP